MKLYELAEQYRGIADQLADLDLPDDVVRDTLEAEGGELTTKATNVAMLVRNLEASAEAIKAAEEAMAARRKALERRAKNVREYLLGAMQHAGISKVESPWFTLAPKKNPPSVDVYEPALLPKQYMRQPEPPPPAPDKKAIGDAIKAGQDVPGARLVQTYSLSIR